MKKYKVMWTATAKNDRYAALYQLALSTGMRQGELLGLQWKDINWDRKTITVQRQLTRIPGGKLEFVQPKTRSSVRTISLGEATIVILKEHQKQQFHETNQKGACWQDFGPIQSRKRLPHRYWPRHRGQQWLLFPA